MARKINNKVSNDEADQDELLKAFDQNRLKPVQNAKQLMTEAMLAAKTHMKKEARINIRLSEVDLLRLKRKAAEEGLPYQSLVSSIIHKFVTGRLMSRA
jgi:predicted DNA binding CopG/RHH family protein